MLGRLKKRGQEKGLRIRWHSKGDYVYVDIKTPALIKCKCGVVVPISPYFEDLIMLKMFFQKGLPQKLGLRTKRQRAASKLLEQKGLGKIAKFKECQRKFIQKYLKENPENLTRLLGLLELN
ncbi:MAG: hypothetical protein E3J76_04605 [Candidatus Aminicenantes bacterium]|nr:MAG: hypothetical protein E3J76_04605 [Candidatus Aminicenantes bacterium]